MSEMYYASTDFNGAGTGTEESTVSVLTEPLPCCAERPASRSSFALFRNALYASSEDMAKGEVEKGEERLTGDVGCCSVR